MCVAEVAEHALTVPRGRTLITAPKLQLVSDAIMPELFKFIPPWTIEKQTKTPIKINLKNGHEIVVYASNDDGNLRSLNLTMFYMEEASEVDYKIFMQLQARLRNQAGLFRDEHGMVVADHRKGIIASNPEQGWLVDNFMLYSNKIYSSPSVNVEPYKKLIKKKEVMYETFLSSSRDNIYLPPGFISTLCVGKTPFWIRKYIDCALEIREGAVYPEFTEHILDKEFPIPPSWRRVAGFDKGFKDETAFVLGAIDPKTGIIYVYDEYYVSRQPIQYHAKNVKEKLSGVNLYQNVQADPTVFNANDRDGKSYAELFYRWSGVSLDPAKNAISLGIERVREYMYSGKLKFFPSCVNIKDEALNYVYPDKETVANAEEKPKAGADHLMDALRYMIMGMPQDPFELEEVYSMTFDMIKQDRFWTGSEDLVEHEDDTGVFILGGGY